MQDKNLSEIMSECESFSLEQSCVSSHPPNLEGDQCFIVHSLFANIHWVEAKEVCLSPTRFRPCMNSVLHSRWGGESSGSTGQSS